MNLELLNELMKQRPSQHLPEWRMFLEVCEAYLKRCKIKNPIIVELGVWKNRQKKFYEQLLEAEHIGIDFSDKRCTPDILGNLHHSKTMEMLKEKLRGRPINILFIDASHFYGNVKKDFELYSPLCKDIIAIHDIESCRYIERKKHEVWKFWDELKTRAHKGMEEYKDFLFLSIYQHRVSNMGIGMIIKK